MRKTMDTRDSQFEVVEVLTIATAIHRVNGYIKKSAIGDDTPNVTHLYNHFFKQKIFENVSPKDKETAETIVEYLQGLSFKAFERDLTEFETNVLKFVNSDSVGPNLMGVAASLPEVYKNKLKQDDWAQRESILSEKSDYVGELSTRGDFEVMVENVRYIRRTSSYLYCCSSNDKDIVKFFSSENLGKVGQTLCLSGYVKSQSISPYHQGKETMINRIKVSAVIEKSVDTHTEIA